MIEVQYWVGMGHYFLLFATSSFFTFVIQENMSTKLTIEPIEVLVFVCLLLDSANIQIL